MEEKYIIWCNESKIVVFMVVDGKLVMMIVFVDIIRLESCGVLDWL